MSDEEIRHYTVGIKARVSDKKLPFMINFALSDKDRGPLVVLPNGDILLSPYDASRDTWNDELVKQVAEQQNGLFFSPNNFSFEDYIKAMKLVFSHPFAKEFPSETLNHIAAKGPKSIAELEEIAPYLTTVAFDEGKQIYGPISTSDTISGQIPLTSIGVEGSKSSIHLLFYPVSEMDYSIRVAQKKLVSEIWLHGISPVSKEDPIFNSAMRFCYENDLGLSPERDRENPNRDPETFSSVVLSYTSPKIYSSVRIHGENEKPLPTASMLEKFCAIGNKVCRAFAIEAERRKAQEQKTTADYDALVRNA